MAGEGWATSVVGPVPAGDAEVVADLLWAAGASAVEERPAGPAVLLVSDAAASDVRDLLGGRWPVEEVEVDGSWRDAWRAWASSVRVDDGFVVHLPWAERIDTDADLVLVLDPGHAFGSGAHPTTLGCLRALRSLPILGRRVLDVGSGSGVLTVATALLGAGAVRGIDLDPASVPATEANATSNGVVVEVSLEPLAGEPATAYDVVVANIGARVLLDLADDLLRVLARGGSLVLSGLLDPQVDTVLERFGLPEVGRWPIEGWTTLLLRDC